MSSKFSRPVPVQQPPPVCKKSVPVMGANFPLDEQTITVAFNVMLFVKAQPNLTKTDGAMLTLGQNIGNPFTYHWETSPFADPKPFAWRGDLKINVTHSTATGIFWWVETGPTVYQFSCFGPVDINMKIWEWKPKIQPFFGIGGHGQILFATTNK